MSEHLQECPFCRRLANPRSVEILSPFTAETELNTGEKKEIKKRDAISEFVKSSLQKVVRSSPQHNIGEYFPPPTNAAVFEETGREKKTNLNSSLALTSGFLICFNTESYSS